ncbi:MAG: aldehyde dehydrogenase family protein, partial [Parvibaculaceae bacterium]
MNKPEKSPTLARDVAEYFAKLGLPPDCLTGGDHDVRSPISGEVIARIKLTDAAEAKAAIGRAAEAFRAWRLVPAPVRGELVRLLGNELRAEKEGLGRLVT